MSLRDRQEGDDAPPVPELWICCLDDWPEQNRDHMMKLDPHHYDIPDEPLLWWDEDEEAAA